MLLFEKQTCKSNQSFPKTGKNQQKTLVDFFVGLVSAHFADGILQHGVLLIEVVDGLFAFRVVVHRSLQEEAEEPLYAPLSSACRQVAEQAEVEQHGSGKDRVAAEEVDLDLHGIAHPSEYVDVVPALLVVVAGRIIVDAHLVVIVSVEFGLAFSFQDGLEGGELGNLLGVEVLRLIEHQTVTVAENIGGEPAVQAQASGSDDWSKAGFHQRLASLEVFAHDRHPCLFGQFPHA